MPRGRPRKDRFEKYLQISTEYERHVGYDIARQYDSGETGGWYKDIAEEQFNLLRDAQPKDKPYFVDFNLKPQGDGVAMLYQYVRKALGTDTKNYPQQIGDPFQAGTMVLMADGTEKAVEDIQIGDVVINHKGEKANVTNTIKKKFTGDLVKIKLRGWHREVTATETHHGMVLPHTQYRFKYNKCERKKFGEMEIGDYMLIPFGMQGNDNIELQFNGKAINVDTNFSRLIGLYLAEGGLSDNGVTFSLHVNETVLQNELIALGKTIFGINPVIYKTGNENCRRVAFNSKLVREFFKNLIPGNIYNKRIPSCIFRSNELCRLAVLRGWLDGDGFKNLSKNAVIGYTSSSGLGHDMARLALSCGIKISSWTRFRKIRASVPNTEIGIYGTEPYKIYTDVIPQRKSAAITCNNTPYGFARPIANIERIPVVDEWVYCITTENEYTAIFNGTAQFQCVSFGSKNACEYLLCVQKVLGVAQDEFHPVFPPYIYGASRVFIGHDNGYQDGSVGAWAAQAVQQYGVIASDEPNVPTYAGKIAKQWGGGQGPPQEFVQLGKKHLVKSAAKMNSWDDVVAAISNGYPCIVCSDQGFAMEADSSGFHQAQGSWSHCMCIIGVNNKYKNPYGLILNSWGDVFGHLKDFETSEDLPVGVIRAHAEVINRMVKQDDTFAFSHMDWFQEQKLPEDLFKLL